MKRALLAAVLAALLPAVAGAQPVEQITVPLVAGYDLDSTSFIYCTALGTNSQPLAGAKVGSQKVKTSGSSTTVTSNTASSGAFNAVAVGDLLQFPRQEGGLTVPVWRYVTARADADTITVNAAVDLSSGYGFNYRTRSCATGASAGWFPVAGWSGANIHLSIDQISVTGGITYEVECRSNNGPSPTAVVVIGPTNATTTTAAGNAFLAADPWDECRLGWKIGSADDGTDTGADAEQVSAFLILRK